MQLLQVTPPQLLESHNWLLYRFQHYSKRLRQARSHKERNYIRLELHRIRQQLRSTNPLKLAA